MQLNLDLTFNQDESFYKHKGNKSFSMNTERKIMPFKTQLLKWVGNKQRFSHEICNFFPKSFNCYYEPFLGSGAVLGTLSPKKAVASDAFKPLIEIWNTLKDDPEKLKMWYSEHWDFFTSGDKNERYEKIKKNYNKDPNGTDFLFLSRSCYGGVIRFRKHDGYMSTPCGVHDPISPNSFSERVDIWHERVKNTTFECSDYKKVMMEAKEGDLIYCDPPYSHSQSILYGAQSFNLEELIEVISVCKSRGVFIVLSIDGTKKSGDFLCNLPIPKNLFSKEIMVNCGRSMLRRFQLEGQTLEKEVVTDRLLLTY
jgi:DNA adenine methylase